MRSGVSESDDSSQVCVHLQELRDLIAIKNCMFAEEQSDCHEFFLYLISEFAGECQSVSQKQTSSIDSEWEEIGSGGRRLELTVAENGRLHNQQHFRDDAPKPGFWLFTE